MTVGFYLVGCALAATAVGAALGELGALARLVAAWNLDAALIVLAVGALIGAALDFGVAGLKLPTVRRQVNDEWLYIYRGWLYGLGFGLQLGLGFATVVNSSALYLVYLAAFLSASPMSGAVIGACFGVVRGISLLASRKVQTPEDLFWVTRSLMARNLEAQRVSALAVLVLGTAALVLAAL